MTSKKTVNALKNLKFVANQPIDDKVLNSLFKCTDCLDSESGFNMTIYIATGNLERCQCKVKRLKLERFRSAIALTPDKFGWITDGLNSVPPSPDIHERQPEVLGMLKKNSDQSFYFYGKTGTHKTTFGWALIQEAGRRGLKVGGNTGMRLSTTMRDFENNQKAPKTDSFYSLAQLEDKNEKFCLLIDEIENFKMSEYGFSMLFEIIEKVQSYGHQLIITSNKSIDDLIDHFIFRDSDGRANAENYCQKIARRLSELCIEEAFI